MKKFLILAVLCLLASTSPVSAQLIIHNNGNAELGVNPFDPQDPSLNPQVLNWLDTVTVLKVFGRYGNQGAGGHLTFGDTIDVSSLPTGSYTIVITSQFHNTYEGQFYI